MPVSIIAVGDEMQIKYIKGPDEEEDIVDVPLDDINIGFGKPNNNAALAAGDTNEAVGLHPYIEFEPDREFPKCSSASVASTSGLTEGLNLVNPSVRKYFRNMSYLISLCRPYILYLVFHVTNSDLSILHVHIVII